MLRCLKVKYLELVPASKVFRYTGMEVKRYDMICEVLSATLTPAAFFTCSNAYLLR